ncbi:MAG: PTS fructose transporter subunit IIA [Gammaproteobacteria bacterium]|nr:PTS fructose transporter subunit IIA [Gammaproteobacteria bacterium]
MIGILVLAHEGIGRGLLETVAHILGERPDALEYLAVDDARESQEKLATRLDEAISRLDRGGGVLVLADIFGASHCNTACERAERRGAQLVSGVNLPMLLRALNHRNLSLDAVVKRAISGGVEGIRQPSKRAKGTAA